MATFRDFCKMPPFLWGLAPVLVLAPALTCIAPNIMIALYAICGTLGVAAQLLHDRRLPALDRTLVYGIAGFVLYGCLSQIWTIAPDHSFSKAWILGGLFFLAALFLAYLRTLDNVLRKRVGFLLGLGLGLGLVVYFFEDIFGFPLFNAVHGDGAAALSPDVKQNKAAVLLSVWVFLAFPFFIHHTTPKLRKVYAGLVVCVFLATFMSESASAQFVLAGAPALAIVLYFLPLRASLTLTLLASVTIATMMPFIAMGVFRYTDWQHSYVLNHSLQSRIEIWDQAARRSTEKPLLGWGLDSARNLPNRDDYTFSPYVKGAKEPIAHLHPHNAPLQIWFETGAVGIAGLCALFVLFYRRLEKNAAPLAQRFGMFMWATSFLYTLSIWGIWQGWFDALLCFAGFMTAAGIRHLDEASA